MPTEYRYWIVRTGLWCIYGVLGPDSLTPYDSMSEGMFHMKWQRIAINRGSQTNEHDDDEDDDDDDYV
jgi:hypothetical protein